MNINTNTTSNSTDMTTISAHVIVASVGVKVDEAIRLSSYLQRWISTTGKAVPQEVRITVLLHLLKINGVFARGDWYLNRYNEALLVLAEAGEITSEDFTNGEYNI